MVTNTLNSIIIVTVCCCVSIAMSSSDGEIYNGPTEFVYATPRGLVDAESQLEFLRNCPEDFMDALERADERTAQTGDKLIAIRVPVPVTLINATYDEQVQEAYKISHASWNLGRVDRSADTTYDALVSIFLIMPVKIGDIKLRDNRGPPLRFVEATENGFKELDLDEMPEKVREEYLKMEKESPGQFFVMTHKIPPAVSDEDALDASVDAIWKAAQINPPRQLADIDGKEGIVRSIHTHTKVHTFTHEGKQYTISDSGKGKLKKTEL